VKIGNSSLAFELRRTSFGLALHVVNDGEKVHLLFRPEIPLGARFITASESGRNLQAKTESHAQDQHVMVDVELPSGESNIQIHYREGVELVMPSPNPSLGEASKGIKLVSVSMAGNAMSMDLDLTSAEQTVFVIRTSRTIESVEGAKFERTGSEEYRLTATPTGLSHEYQRRHVAVNFKK
jgi:hypothetical protein